jgi:hypothetical protein
MVVCPPHEWLISCKRPPACQEVIQHRHPLREARASWQTARGGPPLTEPAATVLARRSDPPTQSFESRSPGVAQTSIRLCSLRLIPRRTPRLSKLSPKSLFKRRHHRQSCDRPSPVPTWRCVQHRLRRLLVRFEDQGSMDGESPKSDHPSSPSVRGKSIKIRLFCDTFAGLRLRRVHPLHR